MFYVVHSVVMVLRLHEALVLWIFCFSAMVIPQRGEPLFFVVQSVTVNVMCDLLVTPCKNPEVP